LLQPTDRLVLRGRGVKRLNSSTPGNQYVHLKVVIPKHLSPRQSELIKEYQVEEAKMGGGLDSEAGRKGFIGETIERIKRALNNQKS
jgi:DnaJ-class molecular chaperone